MSMHSTFQPVPLPDAAGRFQRYTSDWHRVANPGLSTTKQEASFYQQELSRLYGNAANGLEALRTLGKLQSLNAQTYPTLNNMVTAYNTLLAKEYDGDKVPQILNILA